MSLQNHIEELTRRHQALEKELQFAKASYGIEDLKLLELKRRKLLIKDEIAKLRH